MSKEHGSERNVGKEFAKKVTKAAVIIGGVAVGATVIL